MYKKSQKPQNNRLLSSLGRPLILAIETSSRIGSAALAEGPELLAESTFSGPLRHSAEIFDAIRRLLDQSGHGPAQIEQVYIAIGPGSFTGLRIAVTLAKTMHLANQTKIVTVDALDAMAANVADAPAEIRRVGCILDAKRGQFFAAVYERTDDEPTRWSKALDDVLISAADFIEQQVRPDHPIWLLGDGLLYHRDKFESDGVHFFNQNLWSPQASAVHRLGYPKASAGRFADPLTLTPFYLRGPQVTLRKAR